MLDRIKDSVFTVFDCETTGLSWRTGNQIIELAGQKVKDGVIIEEYHELINPSVPVEDGAYNVHGLSNLFLAENGGKAEEMLPKFVEFTKDTILVGHNILSFDVPYLNAELARTGNGPVNNMIIDTLVMARKVLPHLPNHKLGTVATHYEIDPSGAHEYMKHLAEDEARKNSQNGGQLF